MSISSAPLLKFGKLEFALDNFQYKKKRFNYSDIKHIGFYADKIVLYVKNEKPIVIRRNSIPRHLRNAFGSFIESLAQKTSEQRSLQYLNQIDKHGYFMYQGVKFYPDGRVIKNGNIYRLANAIIKDLQVAISKSGFLSPKLKFDIYIDGDVIAQLVDFIVENPGELKINPVNKPNILKNLLSMAAKLSRADSVISPAEIQVVTRFIDEVLKLKDSRKKEAFKLFDDAKKYPVDTFEKNAQVLLKTNHSDKNFLKMVVDFLFFIAISDGDLSAEEELLIFKAMTIFEIKECELINYKFIQEKRRKEEKFAAQEMEKRYFTILGIRAGSSKTEIHSAYRQLVSKFNPDKVHHLGEEFVEIAERKMREINEAYRYMQSAKYA